MILDRETASHVFEKETETADSGVARTNNLREPLRGCPSVGHKIDNVYFVLLCSCFDILVLSLGHHLC